MAGVGSSRYSSRHSRTSSSAAAVTGPLIRYSRDNASESSDAGVSELSDTTDDEEEDEEEEDEAAAGEEELDSEWELEGVTVTTAIVDSKATLTGTCGAERKIEWTAERAGVGAKGAGETEPILKKQRAVSGARGTRRSTTNSAAAAWRGGGAMPRMCLTVTAMAGRGSPSTSLILPPFRLNLST